MSKQTRRAFLASAGAIGIAGCTNPLDLGGSGGTPTDNGTDPGSTASPPPTEGPPTTDQPEALAGLPGRQIESFESLDRWYVHQEQGQLTASTDDPYAGSQSARVASSAGDSFGAIFTAFSEPQDFRGKNLSMAVKLNEPAIAKVSVALLAPDRGNMVRMMRTSTGPTDRWLRVDFGVTTELRDPDLSEVQEIRIVCRRRDDVDEPVDFAVDDLRVVDQPDKGAVMLTFDDSHISHYENAFPAMQDYGFPGVEGVIAESIYGNNRLDVGNMREMRSAGWDMASHPVTHGTQLPEYSAEEQERRIEECKQFLVRKGFTDGARHFLTPQNMRGPKTLDLVKKHHETMFSFGGMPNGLPSTTHYNYGRVNAGNLEGIKTLVDHAARHNQLLVINHHAVGDGGLSMDTFDKQLQYIDGADVEVLSASDLLDRQGSFQS